MDAGLRTIWRGADMQRAFALDSPDTRSRLQPVAEHHRWPWFFVVMAGTLVAIVAAGFAPSFYLRAFSADPSGAVQRALPTHIVAHGIALTLWFALFLVQTTLVASGRL